MLAKIQHLERPLLGCHTVKAEEKREELLRREKENHERTEPDLIDIGSCNEIKDIR